MAKANFRPSAIGRILSAVWKPMLGLSLTDPHPAEVLAALPSIRPPAEAQRRLEATQDGADGLRSHMRVLARRFYELQSMPGGRASLLPEQVVEYDVIGAAFADVRAAIEGAARSRCRFCGNWLGEHDADCIKADRSTP